MNQIMPVGKGILICIADEKVRPEVFQYLQEHWKEQFPDGPPAFVIGPAEIVVRDGQPMLFEFSGTTLSETFVAEFQRWWEEMTRA